MEMTREEQLQSIIRKDPDWCTPAPPIGSQFVRLNANALHLMYCDAHNVADLPVHDGRIWFSREEVEQHRGAPQNDVPEKGSEVMNIKSAPDILAAGAQHMKDRAALRDAPNGERSMRRAVEAFNALEGTGLTEVQGWRFMAVLKHARAAQGSLCLDDYEDAAAYWALAGECAQDE